MHYLLSREIPSGHLPAYRARDTTTMSRLATELRHQLLILSDGLRHWRRLLKGSIPFVRRRMLRKQERKYADLADALHVGLSTAEAAPIEVRKPVPALAGRVCLFVTHAPREHLKSHVVHHIEHLLSAGLQVILVINTDLPLPGIRIDPRLEDRLAGVFVRANRGFDFAAWSHALQLCDRSAWTRLFLVNDSLVGPLDAASFNTMMERIDASGSDITGLTENPLPLPHLQSFFLVLGARVLHSDLFEQFIRHVLNFSDKGHVVEVYEVRLTRTLRAAGFSTLAVFPQLIGGRRVGGDLLAHWDALLAAGFPYVKTRVLQEHPGNPRLKEVRAAAHVDDQI